LSRVFPDFLQQCCSLCYSPRRSFAGIPALLVVNVLRGLTVLFEGLSSQVYISFLFTSPNDIKPSKTIITGTTQINVDHIVDVPAVMKRNLLIIALDVADALDLEIDFSQ
ncbi:MAG: hypothetical protein KAU31_06875, partial [Spirochaetaceae bacterium]|nr:hypothetical protein [Spirochaetaceae bacterium]